MAHPDVYSGGGFHHLDILCIDVVKNFGKGTGFGIGLLFLPFIFFLTLGFGSAQYQGASAVAATQGTPDP